VNGGNVDAAVVLCLLCDVVNHCLCLRHVTWPSNFDVSSRYDNLNEERCLKKRKTIRSNLNTCPVHLFQCQLCSFRHLILHKGKTLKVKIDV
jgi:hypothetical protein